MTTNPNQRIVTVVGAKKRGDRKTYGSITRDAERVAVRLLDDNTASYFLFVHFALHKDKYCFGFSPAALHRELGISEDRCRKAFRKLVDNGYLVQSSPGSNIYTFYQMPPQYEDRELDADDNAGTGGVEQAASMSEVSPQAGISPQSNIPSQTAISPPAGVPVPVDGDTSTAPQGEGYPCSQGEGIPVGGERNTTTNNTKNNTDDIALNKEDSTYSGQGDDTGSQCSNACKAVTLEQRLDKYGYGRPVYDSNGEMIDFVPSFSPLPESTEKYSGDDLPF